MTHPVLRRATGVNRALLATAVSRRPRSVRLSWRAASDRPDRHRR